MLNFQISAKKKFGILTKLMKNSKYSSISSLIDSGNTVEDPLQKADILNRKFATKSTVHNSTDDVPHLEKKDNIQSKPIRLQNKKPLKRLLYYLLLL